ncbi:hypothetical protein [Yinghuangia soli]|uniref:Carboxypeptidase regulatory-like domain-containing protein n=1 Tax=Yinghuangia soli TaxID=2908204 RepID=A0AA41PW23_9ACTN|nr:hypothetical protein [Yinghuangia soli]MCF2526385.1 hypothetical protein [Yinghuangia soli]
MSVWAAGDAPHVLTFDAPSLSLVVEVFPLGPRRRILGQLTVPRRVCLEVRHAEGVRTVLTDDLGRFTVADLPSGLLGFVAYTAAGRRAATHWSAI